MSLTPQDLKTLENLLDKKFDEKFNAQDSLWEKKLDDKFKANNIEWEKKLDAKFKANNIEWEKKLDDKFKANNIEWEKQLNNKFSTNNVSWEEKLDDKFRTYDIISEKKLEDKLKVQTAALMGMFVTKQEFKLLEEKIELLPTKEEFFARMDKITNELATNRMERVTLSKKVDRNEKRIKKIETLIFSEN